MAARTSLAVVVVVFGAGVVTGALLVVGDGSVEQRVEALTARLQGAPPAERPPVPVTPIEPVPGRAAEPAPTTTTSATAPVAHEDTGFMFHWANAQGDHMITNEPPPRGMKLIEKIASRSTRSDPAPIAAPPPTKTTPTPKPSAPAVPPTSNDRRYPNPYRSASIVGQPAPDFETQSSTGATVHPISDRKPLWLTFSLKHCGPCVRQSKDREQSQAASPGIAFSTALQMESLDDLKAYAKQYGLPADSVVFEPSAYGGGGYPFNVFINKAGTVAYAGSGYHPPQRIAEVVAQNR